MTDLAAIKQRLQTLPPGFALDIDDTLSLTWAYWGKEMLRLFGNPENLTWEEIRRKYRRCENVPYWQTPEAMAWMHEKRHRGTYFEELERMEGSLEWLDEIQKHFPIHLYLTARATESLDVTRTWLAKHGFPDVEIVARPPSVPYEGIYHWKSSILMELYPAVLGIIDDDANLPSHMPAEYEGTIYTIGHETSDRSDINVHVCPTWEDVHRAIRS